MTDASGHGAEGGNSADTTRFPCGQWLEECEGCGGKLEVELIPEGSLDNHKQKEMKGDSYNGHHVWC